jgi:uncharacterized membrane protein YedE/YeeE
MEHEKFEKMKEIAEKASRSAELHGRKFLRAVFIMAAMVILGIAILYLMIQHANSIVIPQSLDATMQSIYHTNGTIVQVLAANTTKLAAWNVYIDVAALKVGLVAFGLVMFLGCARYASWINSLNDEDTPEYRAMLRDARRKALVAAGYSARDIKELNTLWIRQFDYT